MPTVMEVKIAKAAIVTIANFRLKEDFFTFPVFKGVGWAVGGCGIN